MDLLEIVVYLLDTVGHREENYKVNEVNEVNGVDGVDGVDGVNKVNMRGFDCIRGF